MSGMYPQSAVGVALDRAVLCPNDETVYDAERWKVCPTCVNKEGISLWRILGRRAASVDISRVRGVPVRTGRSDGTGLLAKSVPFLREEH